MALVSSMMLQKSLQGLCPITLGVMSHHDAYMMALLPEHRLLRLCSLYLR